VTQEWLADHNRGKSKIVSPTPMELIVIMAYAFYNNRTPMVFSPK